MSPEEAAAKADALMAQYRATAPQKKRASQPRVGELTSSNALLNDRVKVFLVFAFGFSAGYLWHAAHVAWSAVMAGLATWSALALISHLRPDVHAPDRE